MSSSESSNPERLDEIIAEYFAAMETGNPLSPDDLVSAHPEFAEQLRAFFDDKRQIDELAGMAKD